MADHRSNKSEKNRNPHEHANSRRAREAAKALERAIRQGNKSKAKKLKEKLGGDGAGNNGLIEETPEAGRIVEELLSDDCK